MLPRSPYLEKHSFLFDRPKEAGQEGLWVPDYEWTWELAQAAMEGEIVGGKDTRSLVSNVLDPPFRWICSISLRYPNPAWRNARGAPRWLIGRGTGTLVGADRVLTAAHILFPRNNGKVTPANNVEVTPARKAADAPFGHSEGIKWLANQRWDPSKPGFSHDFALIKLRDVLGEQTFDNLDGGQLGWWGSKTHGHGTFLKRLDPNFFIKKPRKVFGAGYPGDKCGKKPKTGSLSKSDIERCGQNRPELWAGYQWLGSGTLSWIRPNLRLMHHTIDTYDGQSGGPIWYRYKDRRWMVGVHVAPMSPQANGAVRVTHEFLREVARLDKQLSK